MTQKPQRTAFGRLPMLALLAACTLLGACAGMGEDIAPEPLDQRLLKLGYRQGEAVNTVPGFGLSGWSYVDEYHIQVEDGPGREYLLGFAISCRELAYVERIGYTTTAGIFGRMERIRAHSTGMPVDCPVSQIHKLERVARSSR